MRRGPRTLYRYSHHVAGGDTAMDFAALSTLRLSENFLLTVPLNVLGCSFAIIDLVHG